MKSTILNTGTLVLALLSFSFISAQEKKKPSLENNFKKIDTNKDGVISFKEFKNDKGKKVVAEKKLKKRFAKRDLNKNGTISFQEFKRTVKD